MGRIIQKQTLLLVLLWKWCMSPKKEIYIDRRRNVKLI